jgi:hypothetical protein
VFAAPSSKLDGDSPFEIAWAASLWMANTALLCMLLVASRTNALTVPVVGKPLAAIASSYGSAMGAAPLATNAATSAALSMLSDRIAQRLDAKVTKYDPERTACMAVWGTFISVVLRPWYIFLAWLFPCAASSTAQVIGKVAVNQLVIAPSFNGGFFAFAILTRELPRLRMTAEKRARLTAKLRAELLPTVIKSTAYWSVVQTLNFRYVNAAYAVVLTSVAMFLWTIYLSFIGFRRAKSAESVD